MSDYILFLTCVTVILQHIKIVTIQCRTDWCGWKFVMMCHKVFTSKINVFRSISVDFMLAKSPPCYCYNFPGMTDRLFCWRQMQWVAHLNQVIVVVIMSLERHSSLIESPFTRVSGKYEDLGAVPVEPNKCGRGGFTFAELCSLWWVISYA